MTYPLTVPERLLTWLDVERVLKQKTQLWSLMPEGVQSVDCYHDGMDIAYSADLGGMVQHFAYFPDIRFGLQTKVTYKDGSTDSAGITGMRVAK